MRTAQGSWRRRSTNCCWRASCESPRPTSTCSCTAPTRPKPPATPSSPERTLTDEADDLDRVGHRGSRNLDGRGPESREDRPRTLSRLLRFRAAATLRAGDRDRAKTYYGKLLATAGSADTERPELSEAKAFK